MTIEKEQQKVFNKSIKNVEQANRELIKVYKQSLKDVEAKLAVYRMRELKKPLQFGTGLRTKQRLEKLMFSIRQDLIDLTRKKYDIIVDGYVKNYSNAYYGYGYGIEKDVNQVILKETPYDYSLGYRQVNKAFVRQVYMTDVATQVFGMGIRQKSTEEVLRIQAGIRQQVAQSMVEGLTPRQMATNLGKVDEIFRQNLNHAYTISRTELMRGHSMGSLDSIESAEDAGVQGDKIWDATLDGFTRPSHGAMDSKSRAGSMPNKDGLFVFPSGSSGRVPRDSSLSAKEAVNCRCNLSYRPFGVTPDNRGTRMSNGQWGKVNGDMTYEEWSKTLDGKRNIKKAGIYRNKRAKRLRDIRKGNVERKKQGLKPKQAPVIEGIKARLKKTRSGVTANKK